MTRNFPPLGLESISMTMHGLLQSDSFARREDRERAVILTGSVVTKDVEPFNVVGGNPAKFVRLRPR